MTNTWYDCYFTTIDGRAVCRYYTRRYCGKTQVPNWKFYIANLAARRAL